MSTGPRKKPIGRNEVFSSKDLESFDRFTMKREQDRQQKKIARMSAAELELETALNDGDSVETTNNKLFSMSQRTRIFLQVTQFIVNVLALLFVGTAGLGAALYGIDRFTGENMNGAELPVPGGNVGDIVLEEINWEVAREAAVMAFATSWQAIKLWSRLFVSIVIPTSHRSFQMTREGFIALQPSLMVTYETFQGLPFVVKMSIGGVIASVGLLFYLYEQAKRRRYVERLVQRYYYVEDYFAYRYEVVIKSVSKRSKILAAILPHVAFVGIVVGLHVAVPKVVNATARNFLGWLAVIGLPMILSTRALIIYDKKYNERLLRLMKAQRRQSKRRGSVLPTTAAEVEGWFGNILSTVRKPFVSTSQEEVEDTNDFDDTIDETEEMRPYLTLRGLKKYKTMRGIRPLEYPKFLDSDDASSAQQMNELQDVMFWLKYWVLLAPFLVIEESPISGTAVALLPLWPNGRLFYSLWLQLPGINGTSLAFDNLVPLVSKYWQKVELQAPSSASTSFLGKIIIESLPLNPNQKKVIADIGNAGGTLLFTALPFFFMPSFVTYLGCVLVGLIKPLYSSIVALLSVETAGMAVKKRLEENEESDAEYGKLMPRFSKAVRVIVEANPEMPADLTVANTALHNTHWLEYWVVYTLFMFAQGLMLPILYYIPLWPQLQLAFLLYLQLPYFRGARQFFKALIQRYFVFRKAVFGEDEKKSGNSGVARTSDRPLQPGELGSPGKKEKRAKRKKNKDIEAVNLGHLAKEKPDSEESSTDLDDKPLRLQISMNASDQVGDDEDQDTDDDNDAQAEISGFEQALLEEDSSLPPTPSPSPTKTKVA